MTEINLQERFPQMQPIRSAPSLFRFNGCGASVYGKRDHDSETGTYVKTYCVCILFVPILALRAYRVADASQGWYFLGREPLSGFAKLWNLVLVGGLLSWAGIAAWTAHTSSPDYIAGRQLARAEELVTAGQLVEAARLDAEVITGHSRRVGDAEAALRGLLDGPVRQARAKDAEAIFRVVMDLHARLGGVPVVPDLLERGLAVVDRSAEGDPVGAVAVLDLVGPLAKDPAGLAAKREPLLERAVAKEPANAELASKLALIYEGRNELGKCKSLLAPHKDRLGVTEGARILGQILAGEGDLEASFALLSPYAEGRLKQLHAAEQAYEDAVEQAGRQAVESLQKGSGPEAFYDQYQRASESQKETLVREFVGSVIRDDANIRAKQEGLMREAGVVPVALDLGIVRLRRAQTMTDEQARRGELEAAEKTFLAIRGLAGESDTYRLFLGQVDYWLGKHEEGRKLFDELLASKQRDYEILMSVGRTLRDVGATSEARELIEEAYNKATEQTKKYAAAHLRALTPIELDDEIKWLGQADPGDSSVKGSLNAALGNKAIQEGNNDLAAKYLREAIAAYESQVQSVAVLNNAALAYSSLFEVTGERQAYDKSVEMLDKAVALNPSDSILLFNAACMMREGALTDIIGNGIDLKMLHMQGDFGLLRYLYKDAAGRDVFRQRVRSHPGIAKALTHLDKVLVLAPKNQAAYSVTGSIHSYVRDLPALKELRSRVGQVDLSAADVQQKALDFYAGKEDAKYRKDYEASIAKFTKLVDQARARSRDVTFAVAAGHLISGRMGASLVGVAADTDGLVALAEEAHAAAPSAATHGNVLAALLFRADRTLTQQNAAYAAMASRAGRSLGASHLVAVALTRPGEAREAVMNNHDVRRAMTLVIEDREAFPNSCTPWQWAMLRDAHPDEAAKVAHSIQQDEARRVDAEIDRLLSPMSATEAFDGYWSALIAGKEADGIEILKRCAARGVPMPFELK